MGRIKHSLTYSGGPIGFEAQAIKPSVDAVGEFRVVTNNLSAEYGNRMGGQVFVNIKSGTNALHGTLFEFLRNANLDGTNFFANRSGSPKPPYKQKAATRRMAASGRGELTSAPLDGIRTSHRDRSDPPLRG